MQKIEDVLIDFDHMLRKNYECFFFFSRKDGSQVGGSSISQFASLSHTLFFSFFFQLVVLVTVIVQKTISNKD